MGQGLERKRVDTPVYRCGQGLGQIETPVDIVEGIGVGGGFGVDLVDLVDFDIGGEWLCWNSKWVLWSMP